MSEEQIAERLRTLETDNALLLQQVKQLEKNLDSLSNGINRGLWIIGGGFIAAIVSWIIGGGLSNGG
mgnify:CR=1 FL=1